MASKKGSTLKFVPEDINELNNTQFFKDHPGNKRIQKRSRNTASDTTDEEGMGNLTGQNQVNAKKKKSKVRVDACQESRQKILDAINYEQKLR